MTRDVSTVGKGGTMPRSPNYRGAPKRLNNVTSTFFNMAPFLPNYFRSVPLPQGGFGGRSPPNKTLSPPNSNVKHNKSVELLSIFRMTSPPAKPQSPYWKLSGDGSALGSNMGRQSFFYHLNITSVHDLTHNTCFDSNVLHSELLYVYCRQGKMQWRFQCK